MWLYQGSKTVFVANQPATLTVTYKNKSEFGTAKHLFAGVKLLTIAPGPDLATKEEDQFKEFRNLWVHAQANKTGSDLGPDDNQVQDISSPPLREYVARGLEEETVYFYFFGALRWSDDFGTWETEWCTHFLINETKRNGGSPVWKDCIAGHNSIRHPFVSTATQ